jgi:hypothetical protein
MSFTSLLAHVARVFEGIGAGVPVIGLLLLGLEILVAADLITTVAVAPTVRNVAVLGLIVLIRTFLSVSLQVEIDGRPPWRRFTAAGAAGANGVGNARGGSIRSRGPDEVSR